MKRLVSIWAVRAMTLACGASVAMGINNPARASILGSVLDDMENHIESLQSSLQGQINITEGNILENLRQTIETLRSEFKDDLNKDIDNVDAKLQVSLKAIQDNINHINGDVATERAQIQVAGTKLIQQAAFWRNSVPFIVAGVENQVLSRTDGEYRIRVYGNGFGIDQGDQKYNLRVSFYGQELPPSTVNPLADGIDLILPHSMVDALFFPSQPHRVPIEFNDSIVRECALEWRVIGRIHCTDDYKAVFNVTLAPAIAASATLSSSKNGITNGSVQSVEGPPTGLTPDKHNKGTYPDFPTPVYTAPPGWKIQEAHYTVCAGTSKDNGECQFNFAPHCPVNADKTTVQCFVTVGSHPHTNRWAITIVQQQTTAFPYPAISYDFPSNRNVTVDVPADADAAKLVGQTAQGRPFQISLKPYAGSVSDPVYCPNSPIPSASNDSQVLRFACSAAVD